jgi:hypothetical protein
MVPLASMAKDTRRQLENGEIDLAVLDIRLVDDGDPEGKGGLGIAADRKFGRIPKIMLKG